MAQGNVVHIEFATNDLAASRRFYERFFARVREAQREPIDPRRGARSQRDDAADAARRERTSDDRNLEQRRRRHAERGARVRRVAVMGSTREVFPVR